MPSKIDPVEVVGYYRALGTFVDAFANLEAVLFSYLYELIGIDYDTARAIFSGTRIRDAISFIKRTREVRKINKSSELHEVFSHLLVINDVRDLILHYPTYREGASDRFGSNISRALTEERIKQIQLSEEILSNLEADLVRIMAFIHHQYALSILPFEQHASLSAPEPILKHAWLYKPSPQRTKAEHAPLKRRAKRTPPRESSP